MTYDAQDIIAAVDFVMDAVVDNDDVPALFRSLGMDPGEVGAAALAFGEVNVQKSPWLTQALDDDLRHVLLRRLASCWTQGLAVGLQLARNKEEAS